MGGINDFIKGSMSLYLADNIPIFTVNKIEFIKVINKPIGSEYKAFDPILWFTRIVTKIINGI